MRDFLTGFNEMAAAVHATALDKGWWETERNDGEIVALFHSECSEILEALRHGNPPSPKIADFSSVEEEGADLIIRLAEWGHVRGHRFAEAVLAKAEFNKHRPYRHGGKSF